MALALNVLYAIIVLVAWGVIYTAGDHWPLATFALFSPRAAWLLPLAVLAPATLLLSPRRIWLPLATGVCVLFALMDFNIPWRRLVARPEGANNIRVLTCNLHGQQANPATLESILTDAQPDIVALQDFVGQPRPRYTQQPGWDMVQAGDLLLASRWPIHYLGIYGGWDYLAEDREKTDTPLTGEGAWYAVEAPGGAIHFANIHLASPHFAIEALANSTSEGLRKLRNNSLHRQHESAALRSRVEALGGPLILAGDFNTPDDSPLFRHAWSGFGDAFQSAGWGLGISYAKHYTAIRIDHVLYSPPFQCRKCWIGPDVGSGHRALVADLVR